MASVDDVIFRNPQVTDKLEQMFNNKKCCDTVFLVNEAQFHASSHLITVSNAKLDSIVDTHFENCGDREIKIGPVKHNESFLVLLKYMYGVPINFTQMDKAVMCEVLSLCELYEFNEFSKELKSYFSKFDCIDIDSLVVLLNTSKKYCLKELYEKCTIFAYKNTDQLVNHASFVDLQYHVLLDLIKSDWFCTKEVDILRRTLNWHSNNLNLDTTDEQDNAIDANNQAVAVDSVKESSEKEEEDFGNMGVYSDKTSEASTSTIQNDFETPIDSKSAGVVKKFSENVLKVLLSHIRINKIPGLDLLKFFNSEEGKSHHLFVSNEKFFPNADKARKNYNGELDCNEESKEKVEHDQKRKRELNSSEEIDKEEDQNRQVNQEPENNEELDITDNQLENVIGNSLDEEVTIYSTDEEEGSNANSSTQRETPLSLSIDDPKQVQFTFDVKYGNVRHKSNERFSFEGFHLEILAEYILKRNQIHVLLNNHGKTGESSTYMTHLLKIFLQCSSDKPGSWECDTTLAIRGRYIQQSVDNLFPNVALTEKNNCVLIGEVSWWDMTDNFKFTHNITYTFDVNVIFKELKFLKYSH